MRTLFTMLLLMTVASATAQTGLPVWHGSIPEKKWSVQGYSGFSASFMRYNGVSATGFSTPIGLQLTRRLNQNLYAFAGASIAPTYMNFNRSFMTPGQFNTIPGYFNPNGLNMYQRAEMGLMYVNDAKTFSISGSIGVQRGGNPFYPVGPTGYTKPANTPISHR